MLVNPRSAKPTVVDGIWVRLVDLPTALATRRYTADVDVVLEVADTYLPDNAGRWRLTGGRDGAECRRTDAAADLTLDVRELGAAYLGTVKLSEQAAAGLVRAADPDALLAASAAFAWPVAAYTPWMF
jgi:predicted acetyltransferase